MRRCVVDAMRSLVVPARDTARRIDARPTTTTTTTTMMMTTTTTMAAARSIATVRGLKRPTTTTTTTTTTTRRARGVVKVNALTCSTADFKVGLSLEIDSAPWKITEFMHVQPGRGAAFVRTKLRNLLTGNTNEKTFRSGEKFELAEVSKDVMQYTYMDGDDFMFMNMETFEELRVPPVAVSKFVKEGMDCQIVQWNGKVIGCEVPNPYTFEVVDTDPGLKGNTASGGDKPATICSGAVVTVPLFINIGDMISVNTEDGTYKNRDNSDKK